MFFQRSGFLNRHSKNYFNEGNLICPICEKTVYSRNTFIKHMRTHPIKPFGCDVCGERFQRRYGLEVHLRVHTGEKPYGCDVCGKRFARKYSLNRHKTIHSSERPFECILCPRSYKRKDQMRDHLKDKHREQLIVAQTLLLLSNT